MRVPYTGAAFFNAATIQSVNVPKAHVADNYTVTFLKPSFLPEYWGNAEKIREHTITIASGGSLTGGELSLFTDAAKRNIAMRAYSSKPASSQLVLSITIRND